PFVFFGPQQRAWHIVVSFMKQLDKALTFPNGRSAQARPNSCKRINYPPIMKEFRKIIQKILSSYEQWDCWEFTSENERLEGFTNVHVIARRQQQITPCC
ncbi:hypothetical protein GOP47_0008987, partial [Adiantum capillus-veneris]